MLFGPIKLQGFRAQHEDGPLRDQGQGFLSVSQLPADAQSAPSPPRQAVSQAGAGSPAQPRPAERWRSGAGGGGVVGGCGEWRGVRVHSAAPRLCCSSMTLSALNEVSFLTARQTGEALSPDLSHSPQKSSTPGPCLGLGGDIEEQRAEGPRRMSLHPVLAQGPQAHTASQTLLPRNTRTV